MWIKTILLNILQMQNQNSNFIMDIVNLPFIYSLQLHFSKVHNE